MRFENLIELKTQIMRLDRAEEREVWITKNNTALAYKTDEYKAIWNIDTNKLGCIASSKYKIIQHRDAFMQLVEVLQNLGLNVEGNIKNCRDKVIIDLLFKGQELIDDGEEGIKLGIRIGNSYNMSYSLKGELYAYRLICSNGMVLGNAINDVKLRRLHMGEVDVRKNIRNFIKEAIQSSNKLKILVSKAMQDTLEWEYATKLLEAMINIKKYRDMIEERLSEFKGRRLTRWDIYNAITNIATHGEEITENIEGYLQNKAQKILLNTPIEISADS